jgi:hypothetical protein
VCVSQRLALAQCCRRCVTKEQQHSTTCSIHCAADTAAAPSASAPVAAASFLRLFEELPLCAVVTGSGGARYLCAHGGLGPSVQTLEQLDALQRRGEPPMEGPLCDILWADPADDPGCAREGAGADSLLGTVYEENRLRGCRWAGERAHTVKRQLRAGSLVLQLAGDCRAPSRG